MTRDAPKMVRCPWCGGSTIVHTEDEERVFWRVHSACAERRMRPVAEHIARRPETRA